MTDPLADAIADLTAARTVRVDRLAAKPEHQLAVHATNTAAAREHNATMDVLRDRHAAALARRDRAGQRRTMSLIIKRETEYRAAQAARRATDSVVPCLLDQVIDLIQSAGGANSTAATTPRSPMHAGAVDLVEDIRDALGAPHVPDLQERAHVLRARLIAWRPGDPTAATETAQRWAITARDLVAPPLTAEVNGACPLCGTTYVAVDNGDERVLRGALQVRIMRDDRVSYAECINQACGGRWVGRDEMDRLVTALGGRYSP